MTENPAQEKGEKKGEPIMTDKVENDGIKLKKAQENDFTMLADFYKSVILNTKNMDVYAKWIYGKHPSDEMILNYIKTGTMYYAEKGDSVVSAVAVTEKQGEDYRDVKWKISLEDDEAAVVHILCVDGRVQGQGLGRTTMRLVEQLSRRIGKRALRLDALACNTPAHRLYESLGFELRDKRRWFTENAGWMDFLLYELLL